jgi:hypothetical protein
MIQPSTKLDVVSAGFMQRPGVDHTELFADWNNISILFSPLSTNNWVLASFGVGSNTW